MSLKNSLLASISALHRYYLKVGNSLKSIVIFKCALLLHVPPLPFWIVQLMTQHGVSQLLKSRTVLMQHLLVSV